MENSRKAIFLSQELGLSSWTRNQLKSDIEKYIEHWNRFCPPGELFHELSDSDSKDECSRYLHKGWNRDEHLEKRGAKPTKVRAGKYYWKAPVSATGWIGSKYEWGRDTEHISSGVEKIFEILKVPHDESAQIDTIDPISSVSGQEAIGQIHPDSPQLPNGNVGTSEPLRANIRATGRLRLPISKEQCIPLNDDDQSYQPAASEVDPLEFIRGDTEFDAATLVEPAQSLDSTRKDFASSPHIPPTRDAGKQCGISRPSFNPPIAKDHSPKRKHRNQVDAGPEVDYNARTKDWPQGISSDEDSLPSPQILLFSSGGSVRRQHLPTEGNAEQAVGTPDSLTNATPRAKRRKVTGKPNANLTGSNIHRGARLDDSSVAVLNIEARPASPWFSGGLQQSGPELSHEEDRSQTFVPAPADGPAGNSPLLENPQTPKWGGAYRFGNEVSSEGENSPTFSFSTLALPRARHVSKTLPSMRFWTLVSSHPRKQWKHRPGISLRNETLESFHAAITGHVDPAARSSVDVTLRTTDEDWTFCLPWDDENQFEDMKNSMLLRAKAGQAGLNDTFGTVDVYLNIKDE